ncbi:unnamed protein product, partial [Rotaria sordida]
SFDDQISIAFLNYASAHKITPFQLGLATFYAFLFKLTHGQSDLCITCLNANRYQSELQNMIGMFVATLPYRIQFDSRWSFDELVKHVQDKSPASDAQARIWFHERIHFNSDKSLTAIYNMPFLYRLCPGHTLSMHQLRPALQQIVGKHESLRTSLFFDTEKYQLMQRIINYNDNNNRLFEFIESTFETDQELDLIMYEEKRNSQLFNLGQGHVFRCHILHRILISSNDALCDKDAIIFNFHHALFDFPSMNVLLHDLNQAYSTGQLTINDSSLLRYLDYAAIEQEMPMTAASIFWHETLYDCNLDQSLQLPFDRYRLSDEHRTGRGVFISFNFGEDLSRAFLTYSSSNGITPEQLLLASYFAFLFKLTNGESDLCIGMNTDGRYKEELMSVIGMFVNAIPLRCQLDPPWSFHQLVEHVKEIITNSLKYSYFPLQRILAQHPNATKPTFLETSFEFHSFKSKSDKNEMMIGNARIVAAPISINIGEDEIMSKFDFMLTIQHDLDIDQLSCTISASLDLFDKTTVYKMGQRFCSMLEQLLNFNDIQNNKSIYELSLILPNEKLLMNSVNNTQVIGVMAIEMAGGVYCPLSPRDPDHRLHMLVEHTQSRLVLIHHLTNNKFTDNVFSIDIDAVLTANPAESDVDIYRTSNILITPDNIAYIIFTSGSTGMPKAVGRKLAH